MATKIDLAEQQLLGYKYGKNGYYLTGLIESMGLTKKEWKSIKQDYDLAYMTESEIKEIDIYFDGKTGSNKQVQGLM